MLNEQPPENNNRKVHPLEQAPQPPSQPPTSGDAPRQTATLHIPTVRPIMTYVFIGISVLVFIVRAISFDLDISLFEWGANNHLRIFEFGELHRLLTSMFLHASIHDRFGDFALQNSFHIIMNSYIIYTAGSAIERLFGHARFSIIYILGGLGGSVLSALFNDATVYSVGASGAAFAVLGAEFVYVYQHRKLLGSAARAQMQSLIMLAVLNLGFGLLSSLNSGGIRIDNWGHIGGAIGGLTLAWAIAPYFMFRRHPEHPNALLAEDSNPLSGKYGAVSLYVAALLLILILGTWLG